VKAAGVLMQAGHALSDLEHDFKRVTHREAAATTKHCFDRFYGLALHLPLRELYLCVSCQNSN
jgi:hypothetical protein